MSKLFSSTEKNTRAKLSQTTADFPVQISTVSHVNLLCSALYQQGYFGREGGGGCSCGR